MLKHGRKKGKRLTSLRDEISLEEVGKEFFQVDPDVDPDQQRLRSFPGSVGGR